MYDSIILNPLFLRKAFRSAPELDFEGCLCYSLMIVIYTLPTACGRTGRIFPDGEKR